MIKKLLCITIIMLVLKTKAQQNLVPNGSFETYTACPSTQGQASVAVGWSGTGDSPDYFNSCATFSNFSVPMNWGGYQAPASGQAYCGIGAYLSKIYGAPDNREYVSSSLTNTLTIGTKYFVSFKAAASISSNILSNCAIKKLGALFTKSSFSLTNPITINYAPQVDHNNFITDTLNWIQIFGSFVADSNYKYITIGNFNTDNNTDTLILNGANNCFAYYYIDDACVSTDSIFTKNYIFTGVKQINGGLNYSVYPNPFPHFFISTIMAMS